MIPSTILGLSELLNGSSTRPPVENADSNGTVLTGTANTSRAMADKTLYFSEFSFHHPKMSKCNLESDFHMALSNTFQFHFLLCRHLHESFCTKI